MQLFNVLNIPKVTGLICQTTVKQKASPITIGLYCLGVGNGYIVHIARGNSNKQQTNPIACRAVAVTYYIGLVTQFVTSGVSSG